MNRCIAALALASCTACQSSGPASVPAPSYRGVIAGAAIGQLKEQGFACWLEHRRHVPGLDAESKHALHHTRPVLFCSHWDPTPGLACVERRYAFDVEWTDAKALDDGIVEQLRTRRIGAERFTCVPGA